MGPHVFTNPQIKQDLEENGIEIEQMIMSQGCLWFQRK